MKGALCAKRAELRCVYPVLTGWVGDAVPSPHSSAVARTPRIPPELTKRPFTLQEAHGAGLTRSSLRADVWRHLGRGLYCWKYLGDDPWLSLSGWQHALQAEVVFAGASAGWLFGLDLDPVNPVEILVPAHSGIRSRNGLRVSHSLVPAMETVVIRGLRATSIDRTLADLCHRGPQVDALIAIDMAVRRGLTDKDALGCAGTRRLRNLADLAAPAESPMETRLRWLLIQAGLPCPQVQTDLRDGDGRFVGRADLYYPAGRLVIEYDGGNHRDRLVEDDRRQNLLVNAGFRLLRFTAADIYNRTAVVAAQVRQAQNARNWSGEARASRKARRTRGVEPA